MTVHVLNHYEFVKRMLSLGLDDSNVESANMAFISIIGTNDVMEHHIGEKVGHYFMRSHHNVMNVEFDDTTEDVSFGPYDEYKAKAITEEIATEMDRFILYNVDKGVTDFYIHCWAGQSRSQAVGNHIIDYYGGVSDDTDTVLDIYNPLVKALLARSVRRRDELVEKYKAVAQEIKWYSDRNENGDYIIPIVIDWDYTLTKCSSWEDGTMVLNEEAFDIMKEWELKYNVGFILDTMRGEELRKEPIQILRERGIELYGVARHPDQDRDGYAVTKAWGVMSIDDRNLGTPLKWLDGCQRPHVDWEAVNKIAVPILEAIHESLKQ